MFFRKSLKVLGIFDEGQAISAFFTAPLLALALALGAPAPVLAQVPGKLEGSEIEDQVEDSVEEEVEDAVNESVTEGTEDSVEEAVEEQVEEVLDELLLGPGDRFVEEKVEEQVEETVEEEIEEVAEEIAEETVEEAVEETVEEQVAETVAEEVEDDVEENVEETVEETVEESVADNVEESVEDQVEDSVQEQVADNVEENVQEEVAQTVEEEVEAGVEAGVEQGIDNAVETSVEVQVADAVEERLENEIDDILDAVESDLEVDEERIHREQWLVMAEPEVFEELTEKGYLFDTVTDLPALGMRLAEVAGPSSFDITEVRRGVLDVVGKDRAEVDLNHIYTAGTELASTDEGLAPRTVMSLPTLADAEAPRIGMIDSQVDTDHPALAQSHIESRAFVSADADMPQFHGTAIASIIAANSADYQGLAPDAEIYAAGVFELDEERGEIASTVSLLRALDWLMSSEVGVVNISLAGPPNRLLEAALSRASEQDVVILAAAGNGGPVAQPMYPAAYDTVVAVTAVDASNQVFRLANRGTYLDIAAPGVGLLHARAGGGYAASSGTSFAVPFAAAAAASLRSAQPGADVMALLYQSAEDLGPPGRDEIYGYGLLRVQEG
jgi:subtilisin family serine protease